jgi:tetratricopeptide (TPR) repeat protein
MSITPRLLRYLPRLLRGLPLGALLLGWLLLPTPSVAAAKPSELLDAGRADEVLRLLAPSAESNHAADLNYSCRAYYQLRDWDNAVRDCERAAQLEPGNSIFQLWLGRSYGEKANVAGALSAYSLARKCVAAFATARSLDRKNLAIARDLAEYYSTAPAIVGGGSDKALALAAELAPEHPADAAWVRAMVASNQGRYEQAEFQYNEAIRLDHDSAAAWLDLARFLRSRKSWDRFQQCIEHAVRSTRIRPTDRYDAAELLLVTNRDLPEAAHQMRAYIQGHTEEAAPVFRAHFLLGEILLKNGDASQAAAEYQAALALANSYRPALEALRRVEATSKPQR